MLDIKWIRENKEEFNDLLLKRGVEVNTEEIIKLDEEKRQLITLVQEFQQAKNKKSKKLASLKGKASREFEDIKRDVEHINDKLAELGKSITNGDKLKEILDTVPNLPAPDVPYGVDESMNKFIRDFKKPIENKWAKEHFDLGLDLGMMDFEQTAKISGSRFVTLKGQLASLERALFNFMLDTHTTDFGFEEISPPTLVRPEAMYNTAQLPKLADESYITSDNKFRLIPTGEVPLTNMVADSILQREELPIDM
jgi:seryl-tRNA synthetase